MELIRLQSIAKDFGHRQILEDATLRINAGQRVGLIGPNGGGKTTLVRILTGADEQTSGAITRSPGLRIGYVPQQVDEPEGETVLGCILAAQNEAAAELRLREQELAEAAADGIAAAIDAYENAKEAHERTGGDTLRDRAVSMLDALGLAGREDQSVGALSGGEKNILALTRALLDAPDLLVLDEPGNHLDFDGIAWLEGFLTSFRGAVLVVSHNRYLLDRVVNAIVVLDGGRTTTYAGNYSAYRATILREKLTQQADYVVNQRRLAQLEDLVKRFRELASRTGDSAWGKRLKARVSQLDREKRQAVEKPQAEASKLRLNFAAEASRADIALQVRGYTKSFGDRLLFEGAEMQIASGERVALIGPNGCGKTTLLREIVARGAWDDDTLRIGPSMNVGYCAQEQEVLDNGRTMIGELLAMGNLSHDRAWGVLSQFLFRHDDLTKNVRDLSGGERNRLQLAKLMVQQPDFLVLDEPTNHLDIPACEAVEDALSEFRGTLLVVSHDRYFLDKVAGRIIEVKGHRFEPYYGSFSEYWFERAATRRAAARITTRRAERERPSRQRVGAQPVAPGAREKTATVGAVQQRIEEAEREREGLERRIAQAFTRGDHREGVRASKELERHRARLDDLYDQWAKEEG